MLGARPIRLTRGQRARLMKMLPLAPVTVQPHFDNEPLEVALARLLNKHSAESASDTPDYILADYLKTCLHAFNQAVLARNKWHTGMKMPTAQGGAQ